MLKLLSFHCHVSFGLTKQRFEEALEKVRSVAGQGTGSHFEGRAIAQVVSRRLPTVAVRDLWWTKWHLGRFSLSN
jgi:hypothetical protein